MWWAWMLAGAGVVIIAEIAIVIVFGYQLGKEITEEYDQANNTFYPADKIQEKL